MQWEWEHTHIRPAYLYNGDAMLILNQVPGAIIVFGYVCYLFETKPLFKVNQFPLKRGLCFRNSYLRGGSLIIFRCIPWNIVIISDLHTCFSLRWRHNGRDSVSNHQPHDCLLNRLFGRRSKKTSKLCVIGLCAGNSAGHSPGSGEFPAKIVSNAENVFIWWRHHAGTWP